MASSNLQTQRARKPAATESSAPKDIDRQKTPNLMSFGVGCFHFSSLREPTRLTEDIYIAELKAFLLKNPLVDNFECERIASRFHADVIPEKITENIYDQNYLYPHLIGHRIKFSLRLPHRIQKEHAYLKRSTNGEHYDIVIDYSEGMPVTYVWLGNDEITPSNAISIIWRYFKEAHPSNEHIKFQMVGPSPFHANFFVKPTEQQQFEINVREIIGYDDVYIYAPNEMEHIDIKYTIMYRISKEMSIIYSIIVDGIRLDRDFNKISNDIDNISGKRTTRERIKNLIDLKGDANSIYRSSIDIEKFMLKVERTIRKYEERKKNIERGFDEFSFQSSFEYYVERIRDAPAETYLNIVSIMRERRNNSSINSTVLVAALIGAAIAVVVDRF